MYVAPVECSTLICEGGRHRPGGRFVPIEEAKEQLSTEHPEGAIQMRIGSRVLLDERHWDAIDLLWIELLETCKCVAARRSYSFYFPDQPLEFAVDFEPRKGEVALRVGGERAAVTSRGEFLAVMLRAGSHAMKQLSRIVPRGESRFQRYLTDLQTLEAGLRDGL